MLGACPEDGEGKEVAFDNRDLPPSSCFLSLGCSTLEKRDSLLHREVVRRCAFCFVHAFRFCLYNVFFEDRSHRSMGCPQAVIVKSLSAAEVA